MDQLIFILDNKLNVTTNKASDSFLSLTQSVTGNFYNYQIQSASHGFITASGFDGGTAITYGSLTRNLDGPSNRPEGWGFVFKDHPSQGDQDGSLGFVGADYGPPYPSPIKLKATRYREETAKRPVNIKNIKTLSGSQKVGNYSNEIQLFSVAPEHQKTWALEANDDPNINILPPFISTALPNTTNYQTLMGIAPFEKGNIFGGGATGNRQPDTGNLLVKPAIVGVSSTGSFNVVGRSYATFGQRLTLPDGQAYYVNGSTSTVVSTGSSDTEFWNNLTSSINSHGAYTATIQSSASTVYDHGLEIGERNNSFLTSSFSSGEISTGQFTISCWLSLSPGAAVKYIYREATGANIANDAQNAEFSGRVLYIDGGNRLRLNINYVDGSSAFRTDQYYVDLDSVSQWPGLTNTEFHVVATHSGSVNSATQGAIYINGQSVALTTAAGGTDGGSLLQNSPRQVIINNGRVGTSETLRGTSGRSYLDELVILNTTASQQAVTGLYNCGRKVTLSSVSIIPSASIRQYLPFNDGTHVSEGSTIPSLGSAPLNFIVRNAGGASFAIVSSSVGAAPLSLSEATIALTGTSQTPSLDGTMGFGTATCPATFFGLSTAIAGGVTPVAEDRRFSNDNVIEVPSTASQYISQRNINTRFSAPGGPEIQSTGYLDAYSQTYSVYNALPFRNLSVLGSGSGEAGTIRVEDHLGKRRGLKTLRALHQGKFGVDSTYGVVTATVYPSSGSSNKQHRNTSKAYQYSSGELIITGSNHDNMHINSPIPRSEFQYSWIRSAISGSNWENGQRILGYAPKDGMVSSSAGYVEAIVFPTASTIIGVL